MNPIKLTSLVLVSAVGFAVVEPALGACSHETTVHNNANITLRIVELKSSYAAPVFKTQWTGLKTIPAGGLRKIKWTSDLDCTDGTGVPNYWDVKLIRQNGHKHYCDNLAQSQDVTLNTPDLCFRN